MKLAQALSTRKGYKEIFTRLASRISQCSAYDKSGERKPSDDPNKLLDALDKYIPTRANLFSAILKANQATTLENGMTVSEALVLRDAYADAQTALDSVRVTNMRGYSVLLDTKKLAEMRNTYAREWRKLDDLIQAANWQVEIETTAKPLTKSPKSSPDEDDDPDEE